MKEEILRIADFVYEYLMETGEKQLSMFGVLDIVGNILYVLLIGLGV